MSCLVERNKEGKIIAVKLDSNNVKQTVKLKSGVDFVFEQNTELSSIGTQEEYSQYLESIFPNSKRKEIFYHGTFDSSNKETYFREGIEETDLRTWNFFYNDLPSALNIGMNPYAVMLDFSADINSTEGEYKSVLTNQTSDSAIIYESNATSDEYVVKNRSQIHILGSQNDIEGFRNFVNANLESGNISNNSELFNNILTMPFIDDRTALNMYMSTLTDKFKAKFSNSPMVTNELGEPKLFFNNNNENIYTNYADALKTSNSGIVKAGFIFTDDVVVTGDTNLYSTLNNDLVVDSSQSIVNYKLNNSNSFESLIEIDTTSDNTTVNGFINSAIKSDLLSSQRTMVDGQLFYQGHGENKGLSIFNSQLVRMDAISYLGVDSIQVFEDGTMEFNEIDNNLIQVVSNSGITNLNKDDLKQQLKEGKAQQLIQKHDGFLSTLYSLFREDNPLFNNKNQENNIKKPEDLRIKLLNTLSSLGTKVTSLTNYISNYNVKNNIDPSVEALADISNNVIAFAEGQDTIDNLSEETSHFIIESYNNQQEIEDILLEVETTDEWNQYNKIYYDIYSKNYSGEQLDNIVRREILGKILSKNLQNNFNQSTSLVAKLRTIFNKFVDYVRQFINPTVKKNLQDVIDELTSQVLNENIEDFISNERLNNSNFVLFSVNDKKTIYKILEIRQRLEERLNDLKRTKDVSAESLKQNLVKLNEAINNADELYAVNVILSSLNPQVRELKRQLAHYKQLSEKEGNDVAYFTPEEQASYRRLVEDFSPLLEELRASVNNDFITEDNAGKDRLIKQIDTLLSEISIIKGEAKLQSKKDIDVIIDRIIKQYGLTEKQSDYVRNLITNELDDTSWFQKNFGSLEHASNPFLNILGKIINENYNKANSALLRDINPLLNKAQKEGWDLDKLRGILEQEGKEFTGFTESPYLWGKFKQEELQAEVNTYNTVFGTNLTIEQYNKGLDSNLSKRLIKRKNEFSPEELSQYQGLMAQWYSENTERRYNQEFYDKREQLYKDLDVSEDTKTFLQNISMRRFNVLSKYLNSGNNLDYKLDLNSRDREQLSVIVKDRKDAKSIIDSETGLRKTGSALRLAQDLKKLDDNYQADKEDFKINDKFFETLAEVEKTKGALEAVDWLKINGGILFNDKFWDSFKQGRISLVDKLSNVRDYLSTLGEDSSVDFEILDNSINRIQELLEKKTEILKQFQMANNPSEIDVDNMTGNTINIIKETESELQGLFSKVNAVLNRYDESEVTDPSIPTESTVNESYYKTLKDSKKNETDFILENVTEKDKNNILELQLNIQRIKEGGRNINRITKRFLQDNYELSEDSYDEMIDIINNNSVEKLTIEYGKTKVMPYFKRFAPKGYDEFLKDLKSGRISVSKFAKFVNQRDNGEVAPKGGITDFLSINSQFSWAEDLGHQEDLNPNYINNFEGGIRQPKIEKYLNDKFFSKYSVDKTNYINSGKIESSTNSQEFQMLQALWDLKRKALDAYNETNIENIYKLPQVSKGVVEKSKDFISKSPGKTAINSIKDIIYNRTDELAYGERPLGEDLKNNSDIRLIPKYYLRDLEETSDISTELLHSYSLLLQSAYVYKERLNTISDVMVLEQKLTDRTFSNGKRGTSSSAYEMFKNFMDAYFYGVKRTRQVFLSLPNGKKMDVSKIAIAVDKIVRAANIGFSLPIAATSLTSAEIFFRIENYIGEYTNRNSATWAGKEFAKLAPKMVSETGLYSRDSKLYQLGERFRVYDLVEKTTSSGFNRIMRSMNHLPYKFTEIANFPIAPRIMLTILDDFRLVNGKMITFNDFREQNKDLNLSKKELTNKWNEFRNKSIYNLLESKNGVMEFTQEAIDEAGFEYLEEQLSRVQNKIVRVNGNIDSIVSSDDKSAATRDFLMNFMTAHRGWLSIAIQRRFKKEHFNFATGQVEEGHYITLYNYLEKSFSLMKEGNFKNFIKEMKANYNSLEEHEQRNLKRIMTDLGVYMAMLGIGMLVAGMADDDDNKDLWALQFASYIYFRTTSEVGSTQAPTGVFGLVDVVQAPFIAINSVKEMMKGKGWSFDEVNSGAYEGHSQLYKKLAKQTWLRHYYEVKDAETVKQKSDYYRLLNAETLFNLQKKSKKEEEAEK
jgi:hypothetical protein